VRVVWTREEEFRWAYFRPAGIVDVRSSFDDEGRIGGYELENINSGAAGIKPVYAIPNYRTVYRPADSPFPQGSYRALAATANHFAREMHIDEIAATLRIDPVELRLRNLKDPRAAAVLRAASERFGWGIPRAGDDAAPGTRRGSGIALGWEKGSYIATAVEIEVPQPWDGKTAAPGVPGLRVLRVVGVFDCGAVVNPDNLRNQVEGALVMGLGGALFEAIDFEGGVVSNPRLSQYRVPRFSDVPRIEIVVLDRKDARPAGGGETPIIAIAPALGAALTRATGRRPYGLPLARG
jgi:isoquinoline 1-oxidoreductase